MSQDQKLVEKAKTLEPILRIGKNGLSDSVIEEIRTQLKQKKLIKIKFLRSAMETKDRKELAKEIADKTQSTLLHQVGFVAVFYKG